VVYHFDASKFGLWLKDKYAKPKGVKHIVSTIKNIKTNDMGIEYLILEDGRNVESDIFIDCTGFQSLLLNKTLKEEFISKEDVLPNNHAWAVQLPYKNKEIELEPFTNCTAISNGWCWNIPLWSRLGTGYVYSDKYISSEKALEEFKQYLMSDKMIVPRTESEIENLNFKNIKMRVGIHKRTWVHNVVAIGLSAGFIEPLESNGLFTVHEFLFKLVDNIEQWDMDKYNKETYEIYDDFLKFVALHYAFSKREDSQYWRDILKNKDVVDIKKSYNYSHHGIKAIMVGMNYIFDTPRKNIDQIKNNLDNNKNRWALQASSEPTLYEFLNNLYK
jgi:tryptophan halogenase